MGSEYRMPLLFQLQRYEKKLVWESFHTSYLT